jgi:acylphosphatase
LQVETSRFLQNAISFNLHLSITNLKSLSGSFRSMVSTENPIQARRYFVRGRVQGVGFRWFVEREAHMLGIAGWVRNNHDGSVEVLAQGTRDQLSGLHSRLREGPRAARVDSVDVSDAAPVAGLSSFRIEGAW